MESLERWGRPPVPSPEQRHQRRYEQRPHDERVDQDRARSPDADLLEEHDLRRRERADRHGEHQRRGGDQPPGSLEADRYRFPIARSGVARFLDSREQEYAVVGREREYDRRQDQKVGFL